MKTKIVRLIEEAEEAIHSLHDLSTEIEQIVNIIVNALKNNKKIIFMGNGGSAADAQHLAAEMVGKFKLERRTLPAIALNTNTSILTAIGNDYDFNKIFARQIEAFVSEGDIVVGISTSGNSANVVEGLITARELNAVTIGFTGRNTGIMDNYCDYILKVGSSDTPRIQEAHITVGHIICELVEKKLFGGEDG